MARALAFALALVLAVGAPAEAGSTLSADPARQSPMLAVLSAADVARYRDIFALQAEGRDGRVDALIEALEDPVLVGHVLALRYTQQRASRANYSELRSWMARYADLPVAHNVYALAVKARPRKDKRPLDRPQARIYRTRASDIPQALAPRATSKSIARVDAKIRDLVRRERPSEALSYLDSKAARAVMKGNERDDALALIAASYFAEGVDDRAYEIAADVAARNRRQVPMSDWTAGLAAWRGGKTGTAAQHFAALAKAQTVSGATRAAGAYWAARAYLTSREPARVAQFLEAAAEAPRSFYGVLALRQLGRPMAFDWSRPTLDEAGYRALVFDPGIARAVALWQIDERDLAEDELFRAHGRLDPHLDKAFLALASALEMPAIEIEATECLSTEGYDAGRYPVPDFAPAGGFTLDRALLYAFMRQESRFKIEAKSHAGARGLMQLMPATASLVAGDRSLAKRGQDKLLEPSLNLKLAQDYLGSLMRATEPHGNLFMLAVAYNGGPGNLKRWRESLQLQNDPLLFIESIPAAETRDYIEHVLTNYWAYRSRFGLDIATLDQTAAGTWPVYSQ